MTEDQLLTIMADNKSDFFLDEGEIRARIDPRQQCAYCPITYACAKKKGTHYSPGLYVLACADLEISENVATRIVNAADNVCRDQQEEEIRAAMLEALGLKEVV